MAKMLVAQRILSLPPYLFAEIDRIKRELRNKGTDVIDLSIGDPDLPTPGLIIETLGREARNPRHHRYPSYAGSERFRTAVANWYQDRFEITLNPSTEVLALIGSKEGIAHAPLAFINPGDLSLIPDIGYPVYATATMFAGGESYFMPMTPQNGYQPELAQIPESIARKAKILFLNYPNNPTAAVVDLEFMEKAGAFAKKHEILVCHDAAYTEVTFGNYEPPSFLQVKNAKETGIEFHSLSKTFNMTGWRIGFVVGQKEAIAALGKVKTNVDSGVFSAIQEAGIAALTNWREFRDANNKIYQHRRGILLEGLKKLSIHFHMPKATFYVWCKIPTHESSTEFCARMLRETGVCFTPGIGFGSGGEGYFRISLTASEIRLQEALFRLERKLH